MASGRHRARRPSNARTAVAAIVLAGLAGIMGVVAPDAAVAAPQTFAVAADAMIAQKAPTTNYGSATAISVDASPVQHSLIKFTVSGSAGRPVTDARLRLYVTDRSPSGGVVHATSIAWSETGVTWANAPASGAVLAKIGAVTTGTWADVPITSLVTGDGTYAVRVDTTSSDGAGYASKERGTNPPQIVVTYGTTTPAPVVPVTVKASADQIIDSIGVCVHPTYPQYTNAPLGRDKIISSMTDLGIRHYRTQLYNVTPSSSLQAFYDNARAAGLKQQIIADKAWGTDGSAFINAVLSRVGTAGVSGIEGTNEPDSALPAASAEQAALYTAVRADSRFDGIPFIGVSMAQVGSYATYGNDGMLDAINMHAYPSNFNTMEEGPRLDSWISKTRAVFGAKPLWNTEHGYTTGVGNTNPVAGAWVDEATQGDYVVRYYVWARIVKDIVRSFSYELFDEAGKGLREGNFGLVRADGTPKASYARIKNFIDRLKDAGTGTAATGVDYTAATTSSDTQLHPISRKDGRFDIAAWRATSLWDASTSTRIDPPAANATITLPSPQPVSIFRVSTGAITDLGTVSSFVIPVDGTMQLARVG